MHSFLILLLLGPSVILTVTYLLEDLRKSVLIDFNNQLVSVTKNGKTKVIKITDIVKSYHIRVEIKTYTHLFKCPFYEHIFLVLKERERYIITNLLCKPKLLI